MKDELTKQIPNGCQKSPENLEIFMGAVKFFIKSQSDVQVDSSWFYEVKQIVKKRR